MALVLSNKRKNGKVVQLLLDEPNSYYPDPFDIVITPDGKKAFVSSSGVDRISAIFNGFYQVYFKKHFS